MEKHINNTVTNHLNMVIIFRVAVFSFYCVLLIMFFRNCLSLQKKKGVLKHDQLPEGKKNDQKPKDLLCKN